MRGALPGAHWPLAGVQLAPTPVALRLVDALPRRPVGRPWITLALDVFSRMGAGFYVSVAPPGAMAGGLGLAHAMLPKAPGLAQPAIATSWPIWGVMDTVHADNGTECRGTMLQKAWEAYDLKLPWRPVRRPHCGGHIARLLGTLNHERHNLPGTTVSPPQERGPYASEQRAALTFAAFERWLSILLVEGYPQRGHRARGTTPLQQYEEARFGPQERPGRGLPDRWLEAPRVRLDLMPYEERTVQAPGIGIEEIQDSEAVLRPWSHAPAPRDTSGKRQGTFLVRRDPRTMSRGYCDDPELKQYFESPSRTTAPPPMRVWELREGRRQLKAEGRQAVKDDVIFDAYNRLRALAAEAVQATTPARREAQRRRQPHGERPRPARTAAEARTPLARAEAIQPFDEMAALDGEGGTAQGRCA
jgi:putative transposase